MHLAKYGNGDNVIVGLHGWSGDHTTFDPLIGHLPAGTTFLSADLPGIGKSNAPSVWKIEEIVNELRQELAQLPVQKLSLIGNCSGGLLALFLARHLCENNQGGFIKRLFLIDPFAYFPWYFRVFVADSLGDIGWYAYLSTFANPLGRWITNLSLAKHREAGAHLTESFTDVNHRVTYNYLKLLAESGDAHQFAGLPVPVEIITGEKTFAAIRKSVSLWQKILPETSCYQLSGAGHLPIEEAPAQLAEIVFNCQKYWE